jgi:hypothetical protein
MSSHHIGASEAYIFILRLQSRCEGRLNPLVELVCAIRRSYKAVPRTCVVAFLAPNRGMAFQNEHEAKAGFFFGAYVIYPSMKLSLL